jgi:two-component system sensor histidine kinase/response regulator
MSNAMINVLYVDDEAHNLSSFKASFRKKYKIFTTTSVNEAEEILDSNDIHVILADQRMPIMTGVQFFEKIRQKHPNPIRMLITGYADISAAIDAINKGEVFRFIDKPWDEEYVEIAINNAYEILQNKKQLELRNNDLKKAYEELDKFVYSASHDLRAPLMSILGVVNLANMDKDPSAQKEYLMLIERAVKKMDTFIISIIDYYKNSRGVPEVREIEFEELINDIYETLQFTPGFDKINRNIIVNNAAAFKSDIVKLRIIFSNLITNAIKFQDETKDTQRIDIRVDCTSEKCNIVVEDNGMGIREQDVGKIFNMFYKGRAKNNGSGIGLYIVQESVEKLNGKISVSSTLGSGSRFEVTIPAVKEYREINNG